MAKTRKRWFGGEKANAQYPAKAATPSWYSSLQAYVQQPGQAVWSGRDYQKFADEAYRKNVVANRAVTLIAQGVASLCIKAESCHDTQRSDALHHPLCALLHEPNPLQKKAAFLEMLASYYLLAGNAYVHVVTANDHTPKELHLLRPDRMHIVAGEQHMPHAYVYKVGTSEQHFPVHRLSGMSSILHIRHFHPLHDWYGLAPVESAAYAIDQHNQAAAWNQALLQNGARPSGALVMKMGEGGSRLTEDQFWRLKSQVDEQFSGAHNAGRPLLLEGGLEWKEMSLNPRDMDFLNIKHSSARDIALAFGVPPQMLGIPGDNTYANLAEARLALWEQTILPLADRLLESLQYWLNPMFGADVRLSIDMDKIPALAPKREARWKQIATADFLSNDEKRQMLGILPQMENSAS